MKFKLFALLLATALCLPASGPTIPPGPWDEEEEGETKLAEIDMPVCYPCLTRS